MRSRRTHYLLTATVFTLVSLFVLNTAAVAETTDCTAIASVPYVITAGGSGVYCLTGDLFYSELSGNAIEVQANNVTIDLNGWKLKNHGLDPATTAVGIYAYHRKNITIRNGTVLGFHTGIYVAADSPYDASSGHLVEDIVANKSRLDGIRVGGTGCMIRNNRVVNTGGSPHGPPTGMPAPHGIWVQGSGQRIINNDVHGIYHSFGSLYILQAHAISATDADGVVIAGNRISNVFCDGGTLPGSSGIIVNGQSHHAIIRDNSISDIAAVDVQSSTGILVSHNSDYAVVRGNDVTNVQNIGIYIYQTHVASVCANNIVVDAGTPWQNCLDGGGNYPSLAPPP